MTEDTRTAAGPDGTGGDLSDGELLEPELSPEQPPSLAGKARSARWNVERLRRLIEDNKWGDVEALSLALVDKHGLLYALENQADGLEWLVTGVALKPAPDEV